MGKLFHFFINNLTLRICITSGRVSSHNVQYHSHTNYGIVKLGINLNGKRVIYMNEPLACFHKECVFSVPIFSHLQPNQMKEIVNVIRDTHFKKGEMVYHAEDMFDALYIVNKGRVKIYRLSETGKEQLIRILKPGDFTGELALFQDVTTEHGIYAEALIPSSICVIHRNDVQNLLLKYPSISLKILAEFSNRLEKSEKQTTSFATQETDTRIALYLAELAEQIHDEPNHKMIELPVSKKDLASYLGTTPETLSRQLKIFETNEIIKQENQRQITILDVDKLISI